MPKAKKVISALIISATGNGTRDDWLKKQGTNQYERHLFH